MTKIGSVNACGIATLFSDNISVATCLATPNNIAAAFKLFPKATNVIASYPDSIDNIREDYICRMNGLDMEYHKKFISEITR